MAPIKLEALHVLGRCRIGRAPRERRGRRGRNRAGAARALLQRHAGKHALMQRGDGSVDRAAMGDSLLFKESIVRHRPCRAKPQRSRATSPPTPLPHSGSVLSVPAAMKLPGRSRRAADIWPGAGSARKRIFTGIWREHVAWDYPHRSACSCAPYKLECLATRWSRSAMVDHRDVHGHCGSLCSAGAVRAHASLSELGYAVLSALPHVDRDASPDHSRCCSLLARAVGVASSTREFGHAGAASWAAANGVGVPLEISARLKTERALF